MSVDHEYEMTQADYDKLLEAMKPVPAMYLSGGQLMGPSQQENANAAWMELGERMGFLGMSVTPSRRGPRFFFATPRAIGASDDK